MRESLEYVHGLIEGLKHELNVVVNIWLKLQSVHNPPKGYEQQEQQQQQQQQQQKQHYLHHHHHQQQ